MTGEGAGRTRTQVITFVLLFLLTGSVVLPLKALVLNVLSLSAAFGALEPIMQADADTLKQVQDIGEVSAK